MSDEDRTIFWIVVTGGVFWIALVVLVLRLLAALWFVPDRLPW